MDRINAEIRNIVYVTMSCLDIINGTQCSFQARVTLFQTKHSETKETMIDLNKGRHAILELTETKIKHEKEHAEYI